VHATGALREPHGGKAKTNGRHEHAAFHSPSKPVVNYYLGYMASPATRWNPQEQPSQLPTHPPYVPNEPRAFVGRIPRGLTGHWNLRARASALMSLWRLTLRRELASASASGRTTCIYARTRSSGCLASLFLSPSLHCYRARRRQTEVDAAFAEFVTGRTVGAASPRIGSCR
jgi:hypothetical protein